VIESYMGMCGYGMCVGKVRIFSRINISILPLTLCMYMVVHRGSV